MHEVNSVCLHSLLEISFSLIISALNFPGKLCTEFHLISCLARRKCTGKLQYYSESLISLRILYRRRYSYFIYSFTFYAQKMKKNVPDLCQV